MYHGTKRKIINEDYINNRLAFITEPYLIGFEHKGIYHEIEKHFKSNKELLQEVKNLESQGYRVFYKQQDETIKNTRRTSKSSK